MRLTEGCSSCGRVLDISWLYCPFCGTSQVLRNTLVELLRGTGHRGKARELAEVLTRKLGQRVAKREVNRILYRLLARGVVERNAEFRWAVTGGCGADVGGGPQVRPSVSIQGIADEERSVESTTSPSVIGHWRFSVHEELKGGRSRWTSRCSLCGVEKTEDFGEAKGHLHAFRR